MSEGRVRGHHRGRPRAWAALLLAGLLLGCARKPAAVHWRGPRTPLAAVTLQPAWERSLPFCPDTVEASQDGGYRLVGGERILVLDAIDGDPRVETLRTPSPSAEATAAAAAIGRAHLDDVAAADVVLWNDRALYLDPDAAALHAARARDGKRLWTVRAAAAVEAPLQIYHGRIVLQSLDNYAYCLRADNGHMVWRSRLPGRLALPAAFWEDRLLAVPLGSATLHVLDMRDGSGAGSWTLPGPDRRFVTGPAVAGDRVAVAHAAWGAAECALVALELRAAADQN